MHRFIVVAAMLGLLAASGCATRKDDSAQPAADIHQAALYVSGKGGYASYRIPALVVTKQGTLLAFCEGRVKGSSDNGNIDLVLKRSTDGGNTWLPMQVLVNDQTNACQNPAPVVDQRTGDIILPFTKKDGATSEDAILRKEGPPISVWVMRSQDDGATWSTPVEITSQVSKPEFLWYATGPGHSIQLRDGTLLVPCDNRVGPEVDHMFSHAILSKDGGHTWQLGGIAGPKVNECIAVELADGRVCLNMRSYFGDNRRRVSFSNDGGLSWTPVQVAPALVEPVCQASILRVQLKQGGSKDALIFSNPASTKRERMTVRLSYDSGMTWPIAWVLHGGPAAYSDLASLKDGSIACFYECGEKNPYETITFARFSQKGLALSTGATPPVKLGDQ
ncbi:MAG: glycoside hydrolase [Candidatus Hydrogenedentes bacterium]|nr:glycoside hydrolase [Candidatus Hydrogenedentota bacterium]